MVQFTSLLLPVALFASAASGQFFGGGESPFPRVKFGGPLGSLIGGGVGGGQGSGQVGLGQVLSSLLSQGTTSASQNQSPLQQLATAASNTYIAALRSAMPGFANLMGAASMQQPVQYAMPPLGMRHGPHHPPHGPHHGPHGHMPFGGGPSGFGPMQFLGAENFNFPGHTFDAPPFAGPMSFNTESFNFGPGFNMGFGSSSNHGPSGGPASFHPGPNHHNQASLYGGQFGNSERASSLNPNSNHYNSASSSLTNGPRDNFDRK